MSIVVVKSRANMGMHAVPVTIETHISVGLPKFTIVGLPEAAVKESKDRVRSAIVNSRFTFPGWRIVVNLAPADLPKQGSRFDLPIALSILAASSQIPYNLLDDYEFAGELALSGELRPIQSMLPFAMATKHANKSLICPTENADEVSIIDHLNVFAAKSLLDILAHLRQDKVLPEGQRKIFQSITPSQLDMQDVRGQLHAKRALEIAAAGQHSLLFIGAPGSGKTMLASCLPTILPQLTHREALEIALVQSVAGKKTDAGNWQHRPFRSPHHTASNISLVGGGNPPKPGEISLAHQGVLFLDELPEFKRQALETLREPLESAKINIARAGNNVEFPADFQLIMAMNPCPCGLSTLATKDCRCSSEQIQKYRAKLSAPLLDRVDIFIEIFPVSSTELLEKNQAESSQQIQERVSLARELQLTRSKTLNSKLAARDIVDCCELTQSDQNYLAKLIDKLGFSARAYHRILRVARTIADLDALVKVERIHLNEALSYRQVVRQFTTQDLYKDKIE